MFLGADEFLYMAKMYQMCTIRGRFGSGKTLLAVAIGVEMWRRGWVEHLYSNLHLRGDWNEGIPKIGECRNAAVVFDEAWQQLDSRAFGVKKSHQWAAYLRKRKNVILLPSVFNVDVRFRTLMVQRTLELGRLLWVYRWQVEDGLKPFGGLFMLTEPIKYGEVYDHEEEPEEERGERLAEALSGWTLRKKYTMEERELAIDPDQQMPKLYKEMIVPRGR